MRVGTGWLRVGRRDALSIVVTAVLVLVAAGSYLVVQELIAWSPQEYRMRLARPVKSSYIPAQSRGPGTVVVSFVGDVLMGGLVGWSVGQNGADYPWAAMAPKLRVADLTVTNLESPVSDRGSPQPGKEYTFRGEPGSMAGAARSGVDLVNLANNHALDYGPDALTDTFAELQKNGIKWVGAGRTAAEAATPVVIEQNGLRLAFLGFTDVVPASAGWPWMAGKNWPGVNTTRDEEAMLSAIRAAKAKADVVVVLIHWGDEGVRRPNTAQRTVANKLVKAGAGVVIGHHPHVLQGFQFTTDRFVAWSLGNFIFDVGGVMSAQTAVLELEIGPDGVERALVSPARIAGTQPRPLTGKNAEGALTELDALSAEFWTTVDAEGFVRRAPPKAQSAGAPR